MATDTWSDGADNWNTLADWSTGLPGSSSDVVIDEGDPQVTASFGTVVSLSVGANLTFINSGASTVTGAVTDTGEIMIDPFADDGASLTIGGALDNSGTLSIGPGNNTDTAASTVNVASIVDFIGTTLGTIDINGGSGGEATLNVSSAAGLGATNTLYGFVDLSANALLEFASGEIKTIASRSELSLSGPNAFVADRSATGSNSALTGLASNGGFLYLGNGALVSTTGAVTNTGTISLDHNTDDGGASLNVGGALTNYGTLSIGQANNTLTADSTVDATSLVNRGTIDIYGSATAEATLDVDSVAGFGDAARLIDQVNLSGNSLLEFASGEITSIDAGSELSLSGPDAFIADKSATGSNSALTGLASNGGFLYLFNGASLRTGNLANTADITLDGGSSLTVSGKLSNEGLGDLSIGEGEDTLSAATVVSVSSIANFKGATFGTIDVDGNDSSSKGGPIRAALDVARDAYFGVAGTLEGAVNISYDGQIVFAAGQITTIAANSELSLTDRDAVVADASNTSSNSALTRLKTVTGGLYLYNGASLATTVSMANTGTIALDQDGGDGGSSLTIGGALKNAGTLSIGVGNDTLTAATTVSVKSIVNFVGTTYGTIDVDGNDRASLVAPIPAALDVTVAAGFGVAGTLEGNVNVSYDGQILFGGGQITAIAANSELSLVDPDAVVAVESSPTTNSALKGLTDVAGALYLQNGSRVATTGSLTNSGTIALDQVFGDGGSSLTVGGDLTNDGTLTIGSANDALSKADIVKAATLDNAGTIDASGKGKNHAALSITGAVTNDGTVNLSDDYVKFVGAVSGTGNFGVSNLTTLQFSGAVGSGETVTYGAGARDLLELDAGASFHGTIENFFAASDEVDLTNFAFSATTALYTQTGAESASWTLTDGSNRAVINFAGEPYAKSDFSIVAANGGNGAEIKFV
jgi:hypothetical protein